MCKLLQLYNYVGFGPVASGSVLSALVFLTISVKSPLAHHTQPADPLPRLVAVCYFGQPPTSLSVIVSGGAWSA